jgi:hypothetical protein
MAVLPSEESERERPLLRGATTGPEIWEPPNISLNYGIGEQHDGARVTPENAANRAGAVGPLKQISLTLDWLYQGPNAGFLLAQEKGFYREVGLDAAITAGKGSGSTAQLIASKASQIGLFAAALCDRNIVERAHLAVARRVHLIVVVVHAEAAAQASCGGTYSAPVGTNSLV